MVKVELVNNCIKQFSGSIMEMLEITGWSVTWHVEKFSSKKLRKIGLRVANSAVAANYYCVESKSSDIILFYDRLHNETSVISTILHELIHIRTGLLLSRVTIRADKAHQIEEKLVLLLEKLLLPGVLNGRK